MDEPNTERPREPDPTAGDAVTSVDERAEAMRLRKERVVLETLRAKVVWGDLSAAADALHARFDDEAGLLRLYLLDESVEVDRQLQVWKGDEPADFEDTAMALNALQRPGGSPGAGWKAFREFAGGHVADFREEAERPLGERAAEIAERSQEVASAVSGRVVAPMAGSDATFEFPLFPGVRALVQVFAEDMEFPPEARILFSEGAENFLPPGVLEELGHRLSRRMLAALED